MNQVNTFDQILALNPDCHFYVTQYCHTHEVFPTPTQLKFIDRAYNINAVGGELWSYANFLSMMSKTNFRKTVQRLRPIIENVIRTNHVYYKLKGVEMPYCVTRNPTGLPPRNVTPDFDKLLRNLKNQPPMMHDLRIHARVTGLYENLLRNPDFKPHNQNKAFTVYVPINYRFPTTVNVYSDKIQVMVACSQHPLPYSINGFLELSSHLGSVCEYIKERSSTNFLYEPIPNWVVTLYHFNRDGITIESPVFNYTLSDLSNHSVFYMKHFKDGTVKPRYEEHRTPHKTLAELSTEATQT